MVTLIDFFFAMTRPPRLGDTPHYTRLEPTGASPTAGGLHRCLDEARPDVPARKRQPASIPGQELPEGLGVRTSPAGLEPHRRDSGHMRGGHAGAGNGVITGRPGAAGPTGLDGR